MIRCKSDREWRQEVEARLFDVNQNSVLSDLIDLNEYKKLKKERIYENIAYELRNHHRQLNIKDENGRIKPEIKEAIKKFMEKKVNGERDYFWVNFTF